MVTLLAGSFTGAISSMSINGFHQSSRPAQLYLTAGKLLPTQAQRPQKRQVERIKGVKRAMLNESERFVFQMRRRQIIVNAVVQAWLFAFLMISGVSIMLMLGGVWRLAGLILVLVALTFAFINRDVALPFWVRMKHSAGDSLPDRTHDTGVLMIELEIDADKIPRYLLGNIIIKPVLKAQTATEQVKPKVTYHDYKY